MGSVTDDADVAAAVGGGGFVFVLGVGVGGGGLVEDELWWFEDQWLSTVPSS